MPETERKRRSRRVHLARILAMLRFAPQLVLQGGVQLIGEQCQICIRQTLELCVECPLPVALLFQMPYDCCVSGNESAIGSAQIWQATVGRVEWIGGDGVHFDGSIADFDDCLHG